MEIQDLGAEAKYPWHYFAGRREGWVGLGQVGHNGRRAIMS